MFRIPFDVISSKILCKITVEFISEILTVLAHSESAYRDFSRIFVDRIIDMSVIILRLLVCISDTVAAGNFSVFTLFAVDGILRIELAVFGAIFFDVRLLCFVSFGIGCDGYFFHLIAGVRHFHDFGRLIVRPFFPVCGKTVVYVVLYFFAFLRIHIVKSMNFTVGDTAVYFVSECFPTMCVNCRCTEIFVVFKCSCRSPYCRYA